MGILGGKAEWEGWMGRLGAKAGWQDWVARLGGKAGWQGWVARLGGKAGWQGWVARLGGKAGCKAGWEGTEKDHLTSNYMTLTLIAYVIRYNVLCNIDLGSNRSQLSFITRIGLPV